MKLKLNLLRRIRIVLDIISLLAIIFMVVIFAMVAGILPPPEAAQVGGYDLLLKYGVRMLFLGLFLAGCGIIGVLFLIARFQRLYIYPVEITPQNIEIQYIMAKIMLSANQLICAIYICVLMTGAYQTRIAIPSEAFYNLTIAAAMACGIVTACYFIAAKRNK